MKAIILFIFFLSTTLVYPQFELKNPYETKISSILEDTRVIAQMVSNKKIIESQLRDIEKWTATGTISEMSYHQLKMHYQEYASQMNEIIEQLCSDLGTIEKLRGLKGKKLDYFIENFGQNNLSQLRNAKAIYSEKWEPSLELAATEANSKAIIPALLLILEFGDSLFSSLKELFTSGTISKENKKELFSLGLTFAVNRIENKLKYPSWSEIVTSKLTDANHSLPSYSTEMNRSNTISPSIQLKYFNSQEYIKLQPSTKKIIVGSQGTTSTKNLFATQNPMENGDRFNVVLNGYDHAYFLYYDTETQTWMDPFGKRIIVGKNDTHRLKALTLPSENEFFEIEGSQKAEDFFVVVSNYSISDKVKMEMMNTNKKGVLFLEHIQKIIDLYGITSQTSVVTTDTQGIELPKRSHDDQFIPIYIKIEKQTTQKI